MSTRAFQQVLCCTIAWGAASAYAVGFGRTVPSAVLGQPLNMSIPLRTEPGERMGSDCVSAEVISGDNRLSPALVRVQVLAGSSEQDWIVRISTTSPVEEPVIEVALSAGCERKFMRRFTAFADPPSAISRTDSPLGMAISSPVVLSSAGATSALAPKEVAPKRKRSVVSRDAPEAGEVPQAPRAKAQRRAERKSARESAAGKVKAAQMTLADAEQPAKAFVRPSQAAVPNDAQVARLLLDVGSGPRLRMDMEEPLMRAPGGAIPASGADVGEDLARLQSLEKTLSDLRKERQSSQDVTAGLKSRLAEAESRSRLLPWLGGLLLLVGGVALWLALRMRKQGRLRDVSSPQWWASGLAPDSRGPVPEPPSSNLDAVGTKREPVMPSAAPASAPSPTWGDSGLPPESVGERTVVQPQVYGLSSASGSALDGMAGVPREVSVEELLDLEQQADFFIALGQEDAAVDLLMTHLRGTGGLSPLPYTKLLEIYKRQGDPTAYERIRARFNRRFNVYAPDWDAGPLQGRTLEDYSEAVSQLQQVWASPLDAMAVLEAMLFRKDDSQDMFDLPAYKDVLLLYSLARDLWQQGGSATTEVDVLLPLGDVGGNSGLAVMDGDGSAEGFQLTSFDFQSSTPPGDKVDFDNKLDRPLPDINGLSLDRH